ncbi:hypothetical protein [Listeria newyorkensis]|uniref:hypothetical protein n=1 Tax=Listeria newyorkensis TaxID=1497681 RepID=UPI000D8EBF47|nr:hypothetical protein [Listeria newyorkensis]SQC56495.1 Uncharacterised protein [Listeria newyorkensis]
MKKKLALMLVVVLTAAITLAACGSSAVEPKEAADIAVNTIIFNKDTDKLRRIWGRCEELRKRNQNRFQKRVHE